MVQPAVGPAASGSSPLARGLQGLVTFRLSISGIIPARAGFTLPTPRRGERRGDHPRSRGVYIAPHTRLEQSAGSSPLARGLLLQQQLLHRRRRIIPARAGFTPGRSVGSPERKDHPRSRGVYWNKPGVPSGWSGSSPLARGLLGRVGPGRAPVRIIPARAGFTFSLYRQHP